MKLTRQSAAPLFLIASLLVLVACQTNRAPSIGTLGEDKSVKPGINVEYLKSDLNVSNWVERFEKEGREIFDHRVQIIAATKIRKGSVVADIGSGTGLFTPMLSAEVGPQGKVYASVIP